MTLTTAAALAAQQASQAAEGKRLRKPLQVVWEQLDEEEGVWVLPAEEVQRVVDCMPGAPANATPPRRLKRKQN